MNEKDDKAPATIQEKNDSNTYILFGKDISEIPCFKNSFLYGISGGIVGGLLTFLFTSRPRIAMHAGMATYVNVTLGYYVYCRYNRAHDTFNAVKMQDVFQKAIVFEGTEKLPTLEKDKTLSDV
ncbi:hypothetical protein KPH14_005559 [Odynerus spinipes]|uniref:Cytochrome c oxidase assembly protein COX20, mitochondrial n=1 Tax=Odynerus spinipes TaxID=1348599 RepID=A0AAD9VJF3_9HYME|nr:hypothetical protein KPH14_005559 [Odynerus spinipes]